ncbi:MAG: M81 family metallopeptidase [Acidobacteria bacterium]|nr:M81 family metallopeptidase [Acidobacteriota bacterium]
MKRIAPCLAAAFFVTLSAMAQTRSPQVKPLVAIGSIMHESNSFNSEKTELKDWSYLEFKGEDKLVTWARTPSEVGGMVAGGQAAGFELYPTFLASATPKGPVTKEAFEKLTGDLIAQLKAAPRKLDGILLALHGALVAEHYPQGDEEIMRRVRTAFPKIPIVLTHDYHSAISPDIVKLCDALVGYKQTPHLDTKDRGLQAAKIMAGMLNGTVKPTQAMVKPPMVYNIIYHNTFAGPMKTLVDETIKLERENPKVLAATVAGGYQYSDVPWMGPAVVVVTNNDQALADREAKRIGDIMWAQRDYLVLNIPDSAGAVKQAMAETKFPVALMDTGDNIGGGSAGDSTFILDELLKQKAEGWVFTVADPAAVQAALKLGIGGSFDMEVGGKTDSMHGKPVRVRGKVRSFHEGTYMEPEVRHGGHRYFELGLTAVITVEGSTRDLESYLVLTTIRSSPNSIRQLTSIGIEPRMQRILVAKGTIAPRAAYEPVSAKIIMVDSPGATAINPARFTFKNLRGPMFGLK